MPVPARILQSFDSSERKNLNDLVDYINDNQSISLADISEYYAVDPIPDRAVLRFSAAANQFYADTESPYIFEEAGGVQIDMTIPQVHLVKSATDQEFFAGAAESWVVGVEQQIIICHATAEARLKIRSPESTITIVGVNYDGTTVGTINADYVSKLRVTGLGNRASIIKISDTLYIMHGNVDLV